MHKRRTLIFKNSILVMLCLIYINNPALSQTKRIYSTEVNQKIEEVEHSLGNQFATKSNELQSIEEQILKYNISGLSIAVINNFKVEWAKAYGNIDSKANASVTIQTVFQAASMSKTVNAIALLKMAESRKIDLDTDANTILKSWQIPYNSDVTNEKITLRQLLSHTAGLSTHGFSGYRKTTLLPNILQTLAGEKPANSTPVRPITVPDKEFKYSGGGTTISQLMLTDIENTSYERYIEEQLFQPLGLKHAFYSAELHKYLNQEMAHGHMKNGKPLKNEFNYYPESAAAGLWITPTDLAKILIDLQLSLNGQGSHALSQASAQEMISPPIENGISALGVFVEKMKEDTYLQHSGSNRGFRGKFFISTSHGQGVVVMVNGPQTQIIEEIIQSVARVYKWPGFEPLETVDRTFSRDEIKARTGAYQFNKRSVNISFEKDVFVITEAGKWSSRLIPISNGSFFLKGVSPQAIAEFTTDENGKINGFTVMQGESVTWTKRDTKE